MWSLCHRFLSNAKVYRNGKDDKKDNVRIRIMCAKIESKKNREYCLTSFVFTKNEIGQKGATGRNTEG